MLEPRDSEYAFLRNSEVLNVTLRLEPEPTPKALNRLSFPGRPGQSSLTDAAD